MSGEELFRQIHLRSFFLHASLWRGEGKMQRVRGRKEERKDHDGRKRKTQRSFISCKHAQIRFSIFCQFAPLLSAVPRLSSLSAVGEARRVCTELCHLCGLGLPGEASSWGGLVGRERNEKAGQRKEKRRAGLHGCFFAAKEGRRSLLSFRYDFLEKVFLTSLSTASTHPFIRAYSSSFIHAFQKRGNGTESQKRKEPTSLTHA
mmetsp:Transcript_39709/g.78252  ORF Transcript_39709/g.78252 Transcript_39709/m.78252 type:complete len:204 (+) Transcript_39709:760-1371(+)